jgi:hypothetical protein
MAGRLVPRVGYNQLYAIPAQDRVDEGITYNKFLQNAL